MTKTLHEQLAEASADAIRLQKESNARAADYWRIGQEIADTEGPTHFFKVGERIYDTRNLTSSEVYCAGYDFRPLSLGKYPEQRGLALRYVTCNPGETPSFSVEPYLAKYGWLTTYENEATHKARMAVESAARRAQWESKKAERQANAS